MIVPGFEIKRLIHAEIHDTCLHLLFINLFLSALLPGILAGRTNAAHIRDGTPDNTGAARLVWQLAEGLNEEDFENEAAFEEYLNELLEHFPVDLNRAGPEELRLIPPISDRTVNAILDYRKTKIFTSPEDLLEVSGIGPVTLNTLRPWITVGTRSTPRSYLPDNFTIEQFFRFQQSFPAAEGYGGDATDPPRYPGSPARLYHRQSVSGNRFSGNLTQVKLPGEPVNWPVGFDYTSAHVSIRKTGIFRRIVIGDYTLRYGQGLTLWSAASFGKGGSSHTAPYRRRFGITPYRSSGQIRFFRGLAAEIVLPLPFSLPGQKKNSRLLLSGFISNRLRSAVEVNGDSIRPPSSNPYHRTETERARRNNSREAVHGGNITLENDRWSIGATYYSYGLNHPVVPHPQSPPLKGSENGVLSSGFTINSDKITLFGEYAVRLTAFDRKAFESAGLQYPPNGRTAWIAGAMGTFSETTDLVLSLRNYKPGYWSEYGSGFGEGSGAPVNQAGWYLGFRIRPSPALKVHGFIDRFRFPDPKRGATRPSNGWESMLQWQYRTRSDLTWRVRFRYKERSAEQELSDAYLRSYQISDTEYRLSARIRMDWRVSDDLFLRTQFDRLRAGLLRAGLQRAGRQSQSGTTGMAFGQTGRWQVTKAIRLDLNVTTFETDDYSSRIYLFEHGLSRTMTSRMVYGVGRQSCIVVRYRPAEWLLAEVKYSRIRYFDRPAIGSGHDRTIGPHRSYIGMQLRFMY